MHNKTISWPQLGYPHQLSASADNTNFDLGNYFYHAQPHPIIVKRSIVPGGPDFILVTRAPRFPLPNDLKKQGLWK